jgi:effector-binding domain-containing protein
MKNVIPFLFISFILGGCSIVAKTPEPSWSSVKKEGNIEIRSYDPMIVAETTTTGKRSEAINDGFRILAGYIFGGNAGQKSIEMTAPVTQQSGTPEGEKIAMTAPAIQEAGNKQNEWKVRFVMPAKYSLISLPQPNDERIKFIEVPAYRAVVIRFSGFNTDNNLAARKAELMEWIKDNKIKTEGDPIYAFYNPPWTPPFMKRNEVMVKILD